MRGKTKEEEEEEEGLRKRGGGRGAGMELEMKKMEEEEVAAIAKSPVEVTRSLENWRRRGRREKGWALRLLFIYILRVLLILEASATSGNLMCIYM